MGKPTMRRGPALLWAAALGLALLAAGPLVVTAQLPREAPPETSGTTVAPAPAQFPTVSRPVPPPPPVLPTPPAAPSPPNASTTATPAIFLPSLQRP